MDLGFDRAEWLRSCDRINAHDSDPVYRDEQRAYYDSVRDILAAQNGVGLVRLRDGDQDWTAADAGEVLGGFLRRAIPGGLGRRLETVQHESDSDAKRQISTTPMEGRASVVPAAERTATETRPFRIGLLSFAVDKAHPELVRGSETVVLEILNSRPELDLLVGAGWTVFSRNELEVILKGNRNPRTVALIETWRDLDGTFNHNGNAVRGQVLLVERTPQVFATSEQINRNPHLMGELFNELEARRHLRIGGRSVTWLMCGEVNLLRNSQSEGNRAEFRFLHDRVLNERFQRIFEDTEIFVDPTHTVMGNQGKLAKRRAYLSADGRTFCSVSNVDVTGHGFANVRQQLGGRSVQYFWKDGREQRPDEVRHTDQFIYRAYSV